MQKGSIDAQGCSQMIRPMLRWPMHNAGDAASARRPEAATVHARHGSIAGSATAGAKASVRICLHLCLQFLHALRPRISALVLLPLPLAHAVAAEPPTYRPDPAWPQPLPHNWVL